jgi:membrane protein
MTRPGGSEAEGMVDPFLIDDYTPEGRRKMARLQASLSNRLREEIGPGTKFAIVLKRVSHGAWHDGSIHAGNLAYMAMFAIFPFFILGAAIFSLVGDKTDKAALIDAVVTALPPVVGNVIEPVARNVIAMRSGWLLWAGGLFALWTVGSLVETIRDLLRRAYGTEPTRSFLRNRLLSSGIIIGAVILLLLSLIAQVLIGAAEEVIDAFLPQLSNWLASLSLSRLVPAFGLFGSIYLLFFSLTPTIYRKRCYPKWPGALLVTLWWVGATAALPPLLRGVFSYDLTYGSLAGMMIALFFFWLVGLGMVIGAELNAALAEPEHEEDLVGQADDRVRTRISTIQKEGNGSE